ncbi:MAG: hypothetical protein WCP81_09100 [Actinomycetes bacterium]
MRIASIRVPSGTRAVLLDGEEFIDLGMPDVRAVLADANWRQQAHRTSGPVSPTAGADFAPLVTRPGKVVCAVLNYRSQILEIGSENPH